MAEDDHKIPPIRMDQAMHIGASMVQGLIATFIRPDDDDEVKSAMSYICLSIFLHQLCAPAKHKDKMISVLKVIIEDIEDTKREAEKEKSGEN